MAEKWPTFEVANEGVVHALGIMNINYVRFELHGYRDSALNAPRSFSYSACVYVD